LIWLHGFNVCPGFGKERFEPNNVLTTFIGMSLLWVGWFGFNSGSALSASPNAAYSMVVTQISAAVAVRVENIPRMFFV
jgi:ammonium transporter, Amt family